MNEFTAWSIEALVGVGAEEIALRLQEIGGQAV